MLYQAELDWYWTLEQSTQCTEKMRRLQKFKNVSILWIMIGAGKCLLCKVYTNDQYGTKIVDVFGGLLDNWVLWQIQSYRGVGLFFQQDAKNAAQKFEGKLCFDLGINKNYCNNKHVNIEVKCTRNPYLVIPERCMIPYYSKLN